MSDYTKTDGLILDDVTVYGADNSEEGKDRLKKLYKRVYRLMQDAEWRTLPEICETVVGLQTSASAALRAFRRPKHGNHTLNLRRKSDGLYEYQLVVNLEGPTETTEMSEEYQEFIMEEVEA